MDQTTSKVYFTDMHTELDDPLQEKLERLMVAAGIREIPFEGRFTAIKIHFGEPGNLSFLRPNFAYTVASVIKSLGGKPFLTDCNTLYVGGRKNALDHLEAAQRNGFSPLSTGCQILIADGLKGLDETLVPVEGGKHVTQAKIGRAIMDADVFVSLNHFKGHEGTGFGGALKNIGMGCGSRAGKMEQHYSGKPDVDDALCRGCMRCQSQCAHGAISYDAQRKAHIDHAKCVGCGRCIGACNFDAIDSNGDSGHVLLCEKMAEYAAAVLRGRPSFHINIVAQVSPNCDCHGENDLPIIPDVGMFASFDPVALDQACADACNRMPAIEGSQLQRRISEGHTEGDHFDNCGEGTDWRVTLVHAEEMGVGTRRYELVRVK